MTETRLSDDGNSIDELLRIAARLAGCRVDGVVPCSGGGNNRVLRVESAEGRFALKCYGPIEPDRDRLAQEFDGLAFLQRAGIGSLAPAALAVDRERRSALYEWVEGVPVVEHGVADVAVATGFMSALHALRGHASAAALRPAAEAVLRSSDLVAQIERRLVRLARAPGAPELESFLKDTIGPELERRTSAMNAAVAGDVLPIEKRTLSPSDFGFHNAIRRSDGSLTFIDFEYFGWDDPVKLVADVLWHPAMQLSDAERTAFYDRALAIYAADADFHMRFRAYFPLIGIRWALIALNEFIPAIWERRAFSGKGVDWAAAKQIQLSKARALMVRVHSYREAPVL